MMRKYQVRFGGGPTEKGRVDRRLAGGLPYVLPERFDAWLDPATPVPDLLALLTPLPADLLESVRVGPAVNKVTNDGPECLAPAA
jgi:hypothetical protein